MPLQRGEVQGYDFDRMIVEFTMFNQGKVVPCSISTAAMDDLEGRRDVRPDQRVDQFVRLREVIEERVSRKFLLHTAGHLLYRTRSLGPLLLLARQLEGL